MLAQSAGVDDFGADSWGQGEIGVRDGVKGNVGRALVAMPTKAVFVGAEQNHVMGRDNTDTLTSAAWAMRL